ncbi:hypothetical protein [Micromonospora sp. KC721]|uniref:hypothetical protein n=1 Tax=Micromonospora sp. KC721 TaxID=2530380 RepID=UPI00105036B3|nr:hypothetical protein [Micromonospora sp. KC721]TDB78419.1 hypothetical protein E1182_15835 [Micromonospora sp. KC721]
MDRHRLIVLLTGKGNPDALCRDALDRGANFTIAAGALPASHYARIYDRRERHCRQHGIATLGFGRGVERLHDATDQPVRLGWVEGKDPNYHFQLFFTDDLSAVVACIGIDQRFRHFNETTGQG